MIKPTAKRSKLTSNGSSAGTDDNSRDVIDITKEDDENEKVKKYILATKISFGNPSLHKNDTSAAPAFMHQLNMRPNNKQINLLMQFGTEYEKAIFNNKSTKFYEGDIKNFVNSFQFTHDKKTKVYCAYQDQFSQDKCRHDNNIINVLGDTTKSQYCFVPVQLGRGRQSHFVGIVISVMSRKIIMYNPRKKYDIRGENGEDNSGLFEIDSLKFGDKKLVDVRGNVILDGPMVNILKSIHKKILYVQNKLKTVPVKWRVQLAKNFISQQNDTDCGAFVCFFFQTVALGNPVVLKKTKLDCKESDKYSYLDERKLDNFREWMAFSIFIRRIMCGD